MSNSETEFRPTIEDFRAFLNDGAEKYDMRRYQPGFCPVHAYLEERGIGDCYVSKTGYSYIKNDTYTQAKFEDEIFLRFILEVDGDLNENYGKKISAQECLDILDNL